jgi:hypothetical protein
MILACMNCSRLNLPPREPTALEELLKELVNTETEAPRLHPPALDGTPSTNELLMAALFGLPSRAVAKSSELSEGGLSIRYSSRLEPLPEDSG